MARNVKNSDVNKTVALVPDDSKTINEMIEKIEATKPELLGGKKVKALTKKELREMEDEEIRKSFSIEKWEGELIHPVTLSQLVQLDATPIHNARYAMREINKEHLSHLKEAYEDGCVFPPIIAQFSTMGFIVLDGYHRWQVYLEAILDSLGDNASDEMIQAAMNNALVEIQEANIFDEKELLKFSFSANLAHGLAATTASRGRYAMWLLEDAKERNEKMSLRQAARIAHVSHVAVLKMIGREQARAEKQGKMNDAYAALPEEDTLEMAETEAQDEKIQEHSELEKAVTTLFKSMTTIHKHLQSEFADPNYGKEIISYFTQNNKGVSNTVLADFADVFTAMSKSQAPSDKGFKYDQSKYMDEYTS